MPGAAADLLAGGLNQNLGGFRLSPAATEVERALTAWLASAFGLPAAAGGLIVSGGSMANLTCLKVARDARAGWDVRRLGARGGPPLAVYASTEIHDVVRRAVDALGLGMDALRLVDVDEGLRLRVDALRSAIAGDRARGLRPVAVVASAGTVATGAVDPLPEVADVCAADGLWFHVDASYGGPAVLADDLRPQLAGVERADSIAFDPHKWLATPLPGGCALFRDLAAAYDSFHLDAAYTVEDAERTGATFDFGSHGLEWSRGFGALRIWVSLLAHGTGAYARRISHDAALARYLAAQVEARPEFELVAPVGLSICCFRYVPPGPALDDDQLSALNARLMTELQLDGRAYCSNAVLGRRFVLRACVVGYRTEAPDIDALLDVAAEIGARLAADLAPAPPDPRTSSL